MYTLLTQAEFDTYAAAWAQFISRDGAGEVQRLFQPAGKLRQTHVSFDLVDSLVPLLSTVGLRRVAARFVLLPAEVAGDSPRFRVVLFATDALGGRISAYYLGAAAWVAAPKTDELLSEDAAGLVSFNLAKVWLRAWAAPQQQLGPRLFGTAYGPLQGYTFELSDFMDPLFPAQQPAPPAPGMVFSLRLYFSLKSYYPAYPENLEQPHQTFGLVGRLFPPVGKVTDDDDASGTTGGSSYDMAQPNPPG
ncbi:hypothetical protein [Hymenobacter bucti]|uniref:DUF4255 domain-containing protein n=1 Tax=Hymenobacter bucti TaxID=1844114 RepID=A0ABW4QQ26_9BACT